MKISLQKIENIKLRNFGKRIGFTCSCFDILHSGHCLMLEDAKKQCDVLIVGLQTDPTIDRKTKNKPIQSFEERKTMINSIKYVDDIIEYDTEKNLLKILNNLKPDVRILGTDWKNKNYTGNDLDIEIYWHERTHNYSTSGLRKRIYNAECNKFKNLIRITYI